MDAEKWKGKWTMAGYEYFQDFLMEDQRMIVLKIEWSSLFGRNYSEGWIG